jgi:hypothetical protein
LKNAVVFSKLDVHEAFWHVRLDERSSLLTTIITLYGRYRWARLPFGLDVSSAIFQRKNNEALEGLHGNGTFSIADDIIIEGQSKTEEEALQDNKSKVQKVIARCKERNAILNADKIVVGLEEILFHGHTCQSKLIPKKSKLFWRWPNLLMTMVYDDSVEWYNKWLIFYLNSL